MSSGTLGVGAALACASILVMVLFMRRWHRDRLADRLPAPGQNLASRRAHGDPGLRGSGLLRLAVSRVLPAAGGAVLGIAGGGPIGAVAGLAAGIGIPYAMERARRRREADALETQMPDVCAGLAAALRAGLSLQQALQHAATETEAPVAASLQEMLDAERLGLSTAEAIEMWADRSGSPSVRLVADVLLLHHRAGGNAPAVLDEVVRTLRHRRSAARELRSLTAQARLSGAILGFLPAGFFLFLSLVSREDMQAAYRSSLGALSIGLGFALQLGAFVWIRRILRVVPE